MEVDEQLIERLKNGEPSALDELFNRYYRRLVIFARTIVRDTSIAEEVVADVFIQIWFNRNQLSIKNVRPYFFRSTYNRAINFIKSSDGRRTLLQQELPTDEKIKNESFFYQTQNEDSAEYIHQIISSMPTRRRLVFTLARWEGFSYDEIANMLSISSGTVQQHMVLAMQYVTKQLSKHLVTHRKTKNV